MHMYSTFFQTSQFVVKVEKRGGGCPGYDTVLFSVVLAHQLQHIGQYSSS